MRWGYSITYALQNMETTLSRINNTSNEHRNDGENLFDIRVWRHISKSDARQASAGEVKSRNVGACHVRQVVRLVKNRCIQLFRQLVKPPYKTADSLCLLERTCIRWAICCNTIVRDTVFGRAYFKESVQLQRTEKFQTSNLKFPVKKVSFPKKFRRPFFSNFPQNFSISLLFFYFRHEKFWRPGTITAQPTFCIIHSQNFAFFTISTLFHCSSSKFTTRTAQFPFYNCKLHFTTAQIVISCKLKYALVFGVNCQSKRWCLNAF